MRIEYCTAEKLIHPTPPTPKADKIFNSLHQDQNYNQCLGHLTGPTRVTNHPQPTYQMRSRPNINLQTIKDNLIETQNCAIDKLHDNIRDQNGEDSIFSILNVFDLTSRASLEDKLKKLASYSVSLVKTQLMM